MPMTRGKTATTASSAWFRRRPKTSRSSERKKRSHARTGPALAWPATVGRPAGPVPAAAGQVASRPAAGPGTDEPATEDSVIDIEPLSGERHEKLLQARRDHAEPADPDRRCDKFRADLLRLLPCKLRGYLVARYLRAGQAQPPEHFRRPLRLGGLHPDAGGPGPAQFGERALEDQPPGAHDTDMRAHLFDLAEEVGGHEHRDPAGGDP